MCRLGRPVRIPSREVVVSNNIRWCNLSQSALNSFRADAPITPWSVPWRGRRAILAEDTEDGRSDHCGRRSLTQLVYYRPRVYEILTHTDYIICVRGHRCRRGPTRDDVSLCAMGSDCPRPRMRHRCLSLLCTSRSGVTVDDSGQCVHQRRALDERHAVFSGVGSGVGGRERPARLVVEHLTPGDCGGDPGLASQR